MWARSPDRVTWSLRTAQPRRAPADAVPSQVCGLPSQHQPSFGAFSLIHSVGARRRQGGERGEERAEGGVVEAGEQRVAGLDEAVDLGRDV